MFRLSIWDNGVFLYTIRINSTTCINYFFLVNSGNYSCQVHSSSTTCPELESNTFEIQLYNIPVPEPTVPTTNENDSLTTLIISVVTTSFIIIAIALIVPVLIIYLRRARKNPERRRLLVEGKN